MKMKALLAGASMALGLSLLGAAGAANAGALYQQAWDGSSNFYASQNDSGSNGNFATVADDFKLSSASTVTGVEFVGAFFNPATAMTINNFTINFYADNAGKPGAQVGTASGAPTVVSLGSPGGYPTADYTVGVGSLDLNAGAYWVSIVPDLTFPPQWGIGTSATGNNNAQQTFFGTTTDLGINAAFSIDGTAGVPEPASWALMLLGVSGVGAALRTRRRKAVAA